MKQQVRGDLLYPELSYKIMEAAFEVHNQLGPGFNEGIYENALAMELELRKVNSNNRSPSKFSTKGNL